MASEPDTDVGHVVVSIFDSRIRIGAPFGPGSRTAVLPVATGTIEVDPLRPHGVPHTDLLRLATDDPCDWLADVYGWDVAEFVTSSTGDADTVLPWRPGWLHPVLARLAVARWLAAWGPAPGTKNALDSRLLDAEIGHLTVRCADVVSDPEDIAAAHLDRAGALLNRLTGPALAEPGTSSPAESGARAIRLWAGTTIDLLGADVLSVSPAALRARRTEDLISEDDPLSVVDVGSPIVDADLPRRQSVRTVDRLQILPDLVSEAPDAVYWEVIGNAVHVAVPVSPAFSESGTGPWVRLYAPGDPLPVAAEPLRRSDAVWQAQLLLDTELASDLEVDVFSPELGRGGRVGPEFTRAGLEQDAARLVWQLRQIAYHEPERLPAMAGTARDLAAEFSALPGATDPLIQSLTTLVAEIAAGVPHEAGAWRMTVAEVTALDRLFLGTLYRKP